MDEAIVAKKVVDVALPRDTAPPDVKLPAVRVVPSYVKAALFVIAPPVVVYRTRLAAKVGSARAPKDADCE